MYIEYSVQRFTSMGICRVICFRVCFRHTPGGAWTKVLGTDDYMDQAEAEAVLREIEGPACGTEEPHA